MIIFMRYLSLIFYLKQFRLRSKLLTELNYKMANFLFLDFILFTLFNFAPIDIM